MFFFSVVKMLPDLGSALINANSEKELFCIWFFRGLCFPHYSINAMIARLYSLIAFNSSMQVQGY